MTGPGLSAGALQAGEGSAPAASSPRGGCGSQRKPPGAGTPTGGRERQRQRPERGWRRRQRNMLMGTGTHARVQGTHFPLSAMDVQAVGHG